MHIEAWWMAFQNLGYAPPFLPELLGAQPTQPGRLAFSDGEVVLGSGADEGFVFDNEKWRHTTVVPAFDIDANPVTEAVFAEFVDAGGYQRSAGWTETGWAWRVASGASHHPVYWRKQSGAWLARRFTVWTSLDPAMPILHVNRHEAEACAAWLGRRLPTAGQWIRATQHSDFRWGTNWEWMSEPFAPYPGFSADPYRDYSQPWFHTHGELRGGGPVTDPLLKRLGFRNFYLPHRRDPFAGFRTASQI
jgi:iron(II)-dependent oxidoreductase